MLSRQTSSLKRISHYFQPGSSSFVGAWIAPHFCCIGEFMFFRKDIASVKWSEQVTFSDYSELHSLLRKVVDKRLIRGMPVSVSLATSEVFSRTIDENMATDIESQNVLPQGISWDTVEYSVQKSPDLVFSCIRLSDIDFWQNFFKETGLVLNNLVPSGLFWPRFFQTTEDITFSLAHGAIICKKDIGWKETLFLPDTQPVEKPILTFNAPIRPEFQWCPVALLPALEAVLAFKQNPSFNLNTCNFSAEKLFKTEKIVAKSLRIGAICLCILIAALFLGNFGLDMWYARISHTPEYKKFMVLKQENAKVRENLTSMKEIFSSRTCMSKTLHDIGNLTRDSIWFSEMQVSSQNKSNIVIIGHSLSEGSITQLLARTEALQGIKNAHLEYTEKLGADQVTRLTGGKRDIELFRYKLLIDF
jgi:hypothetical protein